MSNIKMGLTIEEAAECTGIGRNTMRKLVDWGKLPVLKVGRKAIIRRDTLERFMSVNQGRISYITSHARQENLYATYRIADNEFWSNLARESSRNLSEAAQRANVLKQGN